MKTVNTIAVRWDDQGEGARGWVVWCGQPDEWQAPRGGVDCSGMLAGESRRASRAGDATLRRMAVSLLRYCGVTVARGATLEVDRSEVPR